MLCLDIMNVGRSLQNSRQRYENPYKNPYNVLQVGLNAYPHNRDYIASTITLIMKLLRNYEILGHYPRFIITSVL